MAHTSVFVAHAPTPTAATRSRCARTAHAARRFYAPEFGFQRWLVAQRVAGQSRRDLGRDWHRILDRRWASIWDERPHWQRYGSDFPQQVFKCYLEETILAGPLALSGGAPRTISMTATVSF